MRITNPLYFQSHGSPAPASVLAFSTSHMYTSFFGLRLSLLPSPLPRALMRPRDASYKSSRFVYNNRCGVCVYYSVLGECIRVKRARVVPCTAASRPLSWLPYRRRPCRTSFAQSLSLASRATEPRSICACLFQVLAMKYIPLSSFRLLVRLHAACRLQVRPPGSVVDAIHDFHSLFDHRTTL